MEGLWSVRIRLSDRLIWPSDSDPALGRMEGILICRPEGILIFARRGFGGGPGARGAGEAAGRRRPRRTRIARWRPGRSKGERALPEAHASACPLYRARLSPLSGPLVPSISGQGPIEGTSGAHASACPIRFSPPSGLPSGLEKGDGRSDDGKSLTRTGQAGWLWRPGLCVREGRPMRWGPIEARKRGHAGRRGGVSRGDARRPGRAEHWDPTLHWVA
jgi:hypothetical protein